VATNSSQGELSRAERRRLIQLGREYESLHRVEEALEAYLDARAWSEGARILSHLGMFVEAAHVMLFELPSTPVNVRVLTASQRRAALNAALCFARGGARREAVGMLMNLGEHSKAASLLASSGLRKEAITAMRGEPIQGNPWPEGVVFRLWTLDDILMKSRGSSDDLPVPEPPVEVPEDRVGPPAPAPPEPQAPVVLGPGASPLERVSAVMRRVWGALPVPQSALDELRTFVAAGREPGAPREVMATWYAVGRLLEFAGLPGRASDAYKVVPGVLDASFRLERTASGRIETSEGHWMSPRIMERGLMLRPAELPDLARLLATAARDPTPPDAGEPADDEVSDVHAITAEAPRVELPPPPRGVDYTPAPAEAFQQAGPGSLVDGRYQLEELIGTGGMARVYRALDTELGEQVALKLFVMLTGGSGLDRFRREMKLSRKLICPHIVRVFEYGIWKGTRYLTMELLQGCDLERLIQANAEGRLDIAETLQLLMQACEGLAVAHDAGVIHRDIKPQNLFVSAGRRLKVMDFGIAKVLGASSLSLTDVRIGTPRYMAPEQIESGHTVGPSADLYALGGVMYEAITGTPPFQDDDLMPLLLNQMAEMPEPPRYRNPAVPPDVEDIVMKLLRKDPAERYASARELRGELLRCWIDQERIRRS